MMRYFLVLLFTISYLQANSSTLKEMIGQMILVGVAGTSVDDKWVKQARLDIKKGSVGGIILFTNNIESPQQLKNLPLFCLLLVQNILLLSLLIKRAMRFKD